MKIMQIVVLFLSMFVMLGGLALPLYWNALLPYISNIPVYVDDLVRNITSLISLVKSSL